MIRLSAATIVRTQEASERIRTFVADLMKKLEDERETKDAQVYDGWARAERDCPDPAVPEPKPTPKSPLEVELEAVWIDILTVQHLTGKLAAVGVVPVSGNAPNLN